MGETLQILDGGLQERRIVFEATDASVAVGTEKFPDFTGDMIVIDGKIDGSTVALTARRQLTDSANAILGDEQGVILRQPDAVVEHKVMLSLFIKVRQLISENIIHIWKIWVGRSPLTSVVSGSRVFIARLQVQDHSFKSEAFTTILTGFEFPSTGARFDSAEVSPVNSIGMFFSPLVKSCKRTCFAFIIKTVNAGGVLGKISAQFDLLTARAESFICGYFRKAFTKFSPMTANHFRGKFFVAKAAFDICLTNHGRSLSWCTPNVNAISQIG